MLRWLRELDRILRGEATRVAQLRTGAIDISAGGLALVVILLGMFYGACMGAYAVVTRHGTDAVASGYKQLGASAVKVPLL